MSNKGGRVSPDYLADIAPEYAASYLNSIGEINTITGNWKVELMVLMVLLMIAAFVFGKLYMRSMLNIFSEE